MAANSKVVSTKPSTWLAASSSTRLPPKAGAHQRPQAASAALAASDTVSRKPMPSTRPKDSSRARSSCHRLPPRRGVSTCQMWSSESCSSAKTVVAPTTRKSTPTAVPSVDWPLWRTLSSSVAMACAPSLPSSRRICCRISARAASMPNTAPATEIAINSSGASENSV